MTEPTSAQDLFKGRHFDQEIIILCVRWYITFKHFFGVPYGVLKVDPNWDPLRKDPRFEKFLAELAPRE